MRFMPVGARPGLFVNTLKPILTFFALSMVVLTFFLNAQLLGN